jgi:osmoprotectant transport system ATP-binding protein
MIELTGISKRYGERVIVDDLTLAIPRGAFCALVGSSGSGKSTTLKLINRLVPLTAGSIQIGGEDILQVPPQILRRRIGYAIQSIGLFPHWTIAANIATVPRLLRWPEARIAARIDELLALVRLDRIQLDKYPHQLSGGQQQRVGVARALAADPEVLLMDEPLGALDPITRTALGDEIGRIHKTTGKTILFVTHDMDEALRLADLVAILHEGLLVQAGMPLDILERPANDFVREFVGGSAEAGLKRLALLRVGAHVRRGEPAEGEPIDPASSLREALAQMVLRHTDRLAVRDAAGDVAGAIRLVDIVS